MCKYVFNNNNDSNYNNAPIKFVKLFEINKNILIISSKKKLYHKALLWIHYLTIHSILFSKDGELDCQNRDDGHYVIRDLFSYLECREQKSRVVSCPPKEVYNRLARKCTPNNHLTPSKICYGTLAEQNFRDPWNCNKYIKCSNGYSYPQLCKMRKIYNPYSNECEEPDQKHKCVEYG